MASGAFTLTAQGSGFVSSSVVRWNGSNRPTTYINSTELRAAIAAEDVASAGTAQLTVFSPGPGGGVSPGAPFSITSSISNLMVGSTNVAPGQTVSVTLTNGYGGSGDWLALAATSAPNTSYITYVYVGGGVTTKTWSFTMPSTPGTYEFRLFLNSGYVRAATSPTITVGVGGGGGGTAPQLSVSATSVTPGSQVTVTLSGGYGGATDWVAFAPVSASDTGYLQYVYVGAGVTTRTWTVTVPATPGTYEFRLDYNNGYTRAATSPIVVVGSQYKSSGLFDLGRSEAPPMDRGCVSRAGRFSASDAWRGARRRPIGELTGSTATLTRHSDDWTTASPPRSSERRPPPAERACIGANSRRRHSCTLWRGNEHARDHFGGIVDFLRG